MAGVRALTSWVGLGVAKPSGVVVGGHGDPVVAKQSGGQAVMSVWENRMRWHFATQACRRPLGAPAPNLRTVWLVRSRRPRAFNSVFKFVSCHENLHVKAPKTGSLKLSERYWWLPKAKDPSSRGSSNNQIHFESYGTQLKKSKKEDAVHGCQARVLGARDFLGLQIQQKSQKGQPFFTPPFDPHLPNSWKELATFHAL